MDNLDISTLLAGSVFAGLAPEELNALLDDIPYRILEYGAEQSFAGEGEPCRFADIILSGTLAARMAGESGKEVLMDLRAPGELVAPAFFFADDSHYPVHIRALSDTRVLRLELADFSRLLGGNRQVRENYIRSICNITRQLAAKLRLLSLNSVREKVEQVLRLLYREQQSALLRLPESRREMADRLGVHKFSLQRSLRELQDEGLIQVNGRTIRIMDERYFR